MKITVILCTYNRCQGLAKALESAAALKLPESDEWEVLIVDNNSSDHTRGVVEEFCRRHPGRFRYLFEPHQGKSYALNAGIREAHGDVLAFIDDDVTVEPAWLQNLTAALRGREWAGAAGRVLRKWSCPLPGWLSTEGRYERMAWPLVMFDPQQGSGELYATPCGTNIAFRREMFTKHGGFRVDLGPQGSEIRNPGELKPIDQRVPRAGEDHEFVRRLTLAGERLWYEPSAVVYHPVPLSRLTKDYFLAWWFEFGRAKTWAVGVRPAVWGIPRRYFRMARMTSQLLGGTLGWFLALTPRRRFYFKLRVWETAGAIIEDYRQLFGAKRRTEKTSSQHSAVSIRPKP